MRTSLNIENLFDLNIDRGYVIYDGRVLASGTSGELTINSKVKECYLGENLRALDEVSIKL